MAAEAAQMPFIRNLASSDRKLRTASLDSLRTFLSTRKTLDHTDALKLWKGLYYAHYMADRPLPQQRLAVDLAALADVLPTRNADVVPTWFAAFWEVLGERWPHIDALRMDKFLLLVRRVFAAQLRHAASSQNEGIVTVLSEWPFELAGDMRKVPLGLRLHALDLWVDELEREKMLVISEDGTAEDTTPNELVRKIGDMVQALRYSPIKAVRERARECDDDERLPWVEKKEKDDEEMEDGDEEDDDEWGGFKD